MKSLKTISYEELLYEAEVMKAQLEIRNFYLQHTVKDIYENVGQVLSLIGLQLETLPVSRNTVTAGLFESGPLIRKSIADLRLMAKSFYPDSIIFKAGGMLQSLGHLGVLIGTQFTISTKRLDEEKILPGLKLISFKMILDILYSIKINKGTIQNISVASQRSNVIYSINYNGDIKNPISIIAANMQSSFEDRLLITNATCDYRKLTSGKSKIVLTVPYKIINNE